MNLFFNIFYWYLFIFIGGAFFGGRLVLFYYLELSLFEAFETLIYFLLISYLYWWLRKLDKLFDYGGMSVISKSVILKIYFFVTILSYASFFTASKHFLDEFSEVVFYDFLIILLSLTANYFLFNNLYKSLTRKSEKVPPPSDI